MEANGRAPSLDILLQESLRPEARHRICYGNCLPLEQPAGHRKANRRVAQVHYFHRHLPVRFDLYHLQGRNFSNPIGTIATRVRANKAQQCHRLAQK